MNSRKVSLNIVKESDNILYNLGLKVTLDKYGETFVTGSYYLDLMTWRDLDIYVINDDFNKSDLFDLGKEIVEKLNPYKMIFNNECIRQRSGLPKGLYWGIYTIIDGNEWKIDIWCVDSKQAKEFKKDIISMKEKINDERKDLILQIKSKICNHAEYRKGILSIDVYDAVINHNINTIDEFKIWAKKNKGIIFDFA